MGELITFKSMGLNGRVMTCTGSIKVTKSPFLSEYAGTQHGVTIWVRGPHGGDRAILVLPRTAAVQLAEEILQAVK